MEEKYISYTKWLEEHGKKVATERVYKKYGSDGIQRTSDEWEILITKEMFSLAKVYE